MKKLLLFGAGKIGRSFIGQLFSRAGYDIVFADINHKIVEMLNEAGCYKIITLDNNHPEKEGEFLVRNISAVHLSDKEQVIKNIIECDIITLSVGKRGLQSLGGLLAEGIKQRYELREDHPIDIILAENVRDAANLMREKFKSRLSELPVDEYIGLVETSIGKMVPIITEEQLINDPLTVNAEPYNSLIVDELGFRNIIPDVKGFVPKKNMKAWVDRKIFIHNLGHAVLAYQANFYSPSIIHTWEALAIESLYDITRRTMIQSAEILVALYPDEFTCDQLNSHIDDLLGRFSNKALGDTIYRVGCDLSRKLNIDDRLMIPIMAANEMGKDYSLIIEAWVKGCFFKARDEKGKYNPEDMKFYQNYGERPLTILSRHCMVDRDKYPDLYKNVQEKIEEIKKINQEID